MTPSTTTPSTWQPGNDPRLRRRRLLILVSVLPALVLLVLALRWVSLPFITGSAASAHEAGNGAGVRSDGGKLEPLNLVERWRAPFVTGTGKAMEGDLEGGRADLEKALALTGDPQSDCTVRTNLLITIEKQSDAAGEGGDETKEKALAEEGLKLAEEAPEGCLDGSDDGNEGEAGEKMQQSKERLEEKTGQGQDEDKDEDDKDGDDKGEDEEETPEEKAKREKQEKLQEQNSTGQEEADSEQQQDDAQRNDDGGYVEKPW